MYKTETQLTVEVEWEDMDGTTYDATATVTINNKYDATDITLDTVKAFNKEGNECSMTINHIIRRNLQSIAITKALEKVCDADFESEIERE